MYDTIWIPKGTTVKLPWMSRGGDSARLAFQVIEGTMADASCKVYTKESAAAGTQVGDMGDFDSISGDKYSKTFSGLNEMVRIQLAAHATTGNGALVRVFPPTWFSAADA